MALGVKIFTGSAPEVEAAINEWADDPEAPPRQVVSLSPLPANDGFAVMLMYNVLPTVAQQQQIVIAHDDRAVPRAGRGAPN